MDIDFGWGFATDSTMGSLQRSLRPMVGGGSLPHFQEPHPSLALRALALRASLCRPPTRPPPKKNPSYGLGEKYRGETQLNTI